MHLQAVAAAGQLDIGFRLLEDAYALDLAHDSYLMHRKLQDACRTAGDNERAAVLQAALSPPSPFTLIRPLNLHPDSSPSSSPSPNQNSSPNHSPNPHERTTVLQAAIDRHGLTSKKAEASAVVGGRPTTYTCGVAQTGPALESALQALLGRVARTGYVPQARAANFAFVRDSSEAQLANSLAHHAEKLALADLVCHACDSFEISVSIKARHATRTPRTSPAHAPRKCS